jgi:uncharacterized membrane protein
MRKFLRKLGQDTSGAAAILAAMAAPALVGVAAVSIDLASLYLAERELQGLADSAAAAAVSGDIATSGQNSAAALLARKGVGPEAIFLFEAGTYVRDPEIDIDERFVPSASDINAARVVLRREVPLFFAGLFFGRQKSPIVAEATAARSDMVAFELGTKLLSLSSSLPNKFLSALAGTELGLTDQEIARLAGRQVDVITLADELRGRQGDPDLMYGQVFDATSSLSDVVTAIGSASGDPSTTAILSRVASELTGDGVVMSELIELGVLRSLDVDDGQTGVTVDAYTLLRAVIEASHGPSYVIEVDANIPGLTSAKVRIAGGYGYERSPWLTISQAGDVVLRSALTRIYVQGNVTPALAQLGSIRLPLYVELAPAEAQITDVECDSSSPDNGVRIGVTPSLGKLAIADVSLDQFDNLAIEPSLGDARLVTTPVLAVRGFAAASLGGLQTQQVSFSMAEIERGMRKEVGTVDIVEGATTSLLDTLHLEVSTVGLSLGLTGGALRTATISGLLSVAPAIDGVLTQLTNTVGLKVGVGEVGVLRLSCGAPALVA